MLSQNPPNTKTVIKIDIMVQKIRQYCKMYHLFKWPWINVG